MPGLFPGIHFSRKERIEMEQKRNAKGEGSFKINKDGTVTHRKSVGYKANGQRKILTVTAANKTACIREMKKKEIQWEKQKNAEQIMGGTTVVELCYLHLKYQTEQKELRPKSIDRRECTIDRHIDGYTLGRMQVQAVKVADIDNHITELIREEKLSASSIEKVVDVLNAAYNWAMVRGELEKNPVVPIKPTLVKRIQRLQQKSANEADVDVLSVEEEKKFCSEALSVHESTGKYRYAAGLYGMLLLHTGMRCGDDDDKIRLNQRKPSKYKGLSRFGPEKNLQRINKFMKERPTFYKKLIQMKENFRFYLRCFYCITKVVILQFNSEKQDRISS